MSEILSAEYLHGAAKNSGLNFVKDIVASHEALRAEVARLTAEAEVRPKRITEAEWGELQALGAWLRSEGCSSLALTHLMRVGNTFDYVVTRLKEEKGRAGRAEAQVVRLTEALREAEAAFLAIEAAPTSWLDAHSPVRRSAKAVRVGILAALAGSTQEEQG